MWLSSGAAGTSACRSRSRSPTAGARVGHLRRQRGRRRPRSTRAGCRSPSRAPTRCCSGCWRRPLGGRRPTPRSWPRRSTSSWSSARRSTSTSTPTRTRSRTALGELRRPPPRRPAPRAAQHRLPRRDRRWSSDCSPSSGSAIDVAFCPERIAEGKAMDELFELPQIVSAARTRACERAAGCSATLTDTDRRARARGSRARQALHEHRGATSSSRRRTSST